MSYSILKEFESARQSIKKIEDSKEVNNLLGYLIEEYKEDLADQFSIMVRKPKI